VYCDTNNTEPHLTEIMEDKLDFAERDQCKLVLLRIAKAGNLKKPLMSLYMEPNGGGVAMDSGRKFKDEVPFPKESINWLLNRFADLFLRIGYLLM
jgi:hypothetical protein